MNKIDSIEAYQIFHTLTTDELECWPQICSADWGDYSIHDEEFKRYGLLNKIELNAQTEKVNAYIVADNIEQAITKYFAYRRFVQSKLFATFLSDIGIIPANPDCATLLVAYPIVNEILVKGATSRYLIYPFTIKHMHYATNMEKIWTDEKNPVYIYSNDLYKLMLALM